jgi:prevent-host-death family protein
MKKTVSAMEARRKFGELLEDASRGDQIVIERAGKVMGVLVPPDQFLIMEQNRDRLYKMFQDAWERTNEIGAEEADRIAMEAVRSVRAKRRSARRSA